MHTSAQREQCSYSNHTPDKHYLLRITESPHHIPEYLLKVQVSSLNKPQVQLRSAGMTGAEFIPNKVWKQRKNIILLTKLGIGKIKKGNQPVCSVITWHSLTIPNPPFESKGSFALARSCRESFKGTSRIFTEVRIWLKIYLFTVISLYITKNLEYFCNYKL